VKDRVNSVNNAFLKGKLLINSKTCPNLVRSLEQQVYTESGVPDKTAGYDHLNDALGYMITYELSLVKPRAGGKGKAVVRNLLV
jgi:hypothetical protein